MKRKAGRVEGENYTWREGNSFELLLDGDLFFPRMLESINSARSFVLLEMYLFESGEVAKRFIDALCKSVKRGVKVYIFLDDFGSRLLKNQDKNRLVESGSHLLFYNPIKYGKWRHNLYRNHRKLLIVDGAVAFTGGAGITDMFTLGQDNTGFWHEAMTEIRGPVVADWQHSFKRLWNDSAKIPVQLPSAQPPLQPDNMRGRVAFTDPDHRQEIIRSLINKIRSAKKRIWLSSPYFMPTWKIRRALRKASRKGVDVCLLLPGPHIDHPAIRHTGRYYYRHLLQSGVRIFEYQPRFIHCKVLMCDHWVSIGSSNLDRWSLHWNLEANQEIDDSCFAVNVEQMFKKDFTESKEIDLSRWLKRPWLYRIGEYFWGTVILWLDRFLQIKTIGQKQSSEQSKPSRVKRR